MYVREMQDESDSVVSLNSVLVNRRQDGDGFSRNNTGCH